MRQTRFFSSENKRLADETSRETNSHFLNGRAKPLFLNKMLAPRRTAFAPARRLVHRPRSLPPKSVWPLMQASKKMYGQMHIVPDYCASPPCHPGYLQCMLPSWALNAEPHQAAEMKIYMATQCKSREVAEPMIKPSRNKGRFNQFYSSPTHIPTHRSREGCDEGGCG